MTTFGPYQATVVAIHDGDTLDVDIKIGSFGRLQTPRDFGFDIVRGPDGIWLRRQPVRLAGCNAPELATDAGKRSLAFLKTEVKLGDTVRLLSLGWDKYGGRIDGQVTLADGRDLTAVMIAAGQAAPWNGQGPKPTATAIQRAEDLATGTATLAGETADTPSVSGTEVTTDVAAKRPTTIAPHSRRPRL